MKGSPSVLIVRLDAIGDALALTPLIAALSERGARVSAVLTPRNAEIFSRAALENVHIARFPQRVNSIAARREATQLGAELASRQYDYALIATEDWAGYRLARASRAPQRIGFENGWGKPLKTLWARRMCTKTIYRTAGLDPRAPHECEVLFQLGSDLLGTTSIPRDPRQLRRLVIDSDPLPDNQVLFQVTDKWERLGAPLEQTAQLARALSELSSVRFVAAESEREYATRFANASGVSIEYFQSLAPWKESIAAARAIVAPDSGAVHVAGMTGTPVLAVFQAQYFGLQVSRWRPWAAPYKLVKMELEWPLTAAAALRELIAGIASSDKV